MSMKKKVMVFFSYYLLDGLLGEADTDNDRVITVPDTNKYIAKKMHEWCIENGFQQDPTLQYDVSGDFIFVRVPEKVIDQTVTINVQAIHPIERLTKIIDELALMSFKEVYNTYEPFEELKIILANYNLNAGKELLTQLTMTRFSSSYTESSLMSLASPITEITEIKKWLKIKPKILQFFIFEFEGSTNFEYAGKMAQIIENLIPLFTDEELLRIIDSIESNDQINSSFKARSHLISIINSSRNILPLERYKKLRDMFGY